MMNGNPLAQHPVVSREDWITARRLLLVKEKEFTHRRDEFNRQRRELPWVEVDRPYEFTGPSGKESLGDLFAGRSQLVVYHFMFSPDWKAGCSHCSFWADHFNPAVVHLNQRDVTMVAVSRAPIDKIEEFRERMGWTFTWMSSGTSTFNFDFDVSFTPEQRKEKQTRYNLSSEDPGASDREGISVFYQDRAGTIFHTYSSHARGIDLLNTAYNYLDLVPKGRDEQGRGPYWVKRHDEYGK